RGRAAMEVDLPDGDGAAGERLLQEMEVGDPLVPGIEAEAEDLEPARRDRWQDLEVPQEAEDWRELRGDHRSTPFASPLQHPQCSARPRGVVKDFLPAGLQQLLAASPGGAQNSSRKRGANRSGAGSGGSVGLPELLQPVLIGR